MFMIFVLNIIPTSYQLHLIILNNCCMSASVSKCCIICDKIPVNTIVWLPYVFQDSIWYATYYLDLVVENHWCVLESRTEFSMRINDLPIFAIFWLHNVISSTVISGTTNNK